MGIANKSLKQANASEKKRAGEAEKETRKYLEKVDIILNKTLNEIEGIVGNQNKALNNKKYEEKLKYIKKSIPYTVQQVKSRLHIICSFEFSKMDSKRLNNLYEVRTLIAGIYNGFYGYERNLINNNFILEEYVRYLKDTLEDIEIVSNSLYFEPTCNISNN